MHPSWRWCPLSSAPRPRTFSLLSVGATILLVISARRGSSLDPARLSSPAVRWGAQSGADGDLPPEHQEGFETEIDESLSVEARDHSNDDPSTLQASANFHNNCTLHTESHQRANAGPKNTSCPPKIIETAVFIDQELDKKFDGTQEDPAEVSRLVLTIMNQVQHLFNYSSLRVPIQIKLVLVEHLKNLLADNPAPDPSKGDIDVYLSNFCAWQYEYLIRQQEVWWDHAILLSGLDLYKAMPSKNHSGVLGLAWVGGMCKGNYSCTINEASNLESAFVIAHEIGHSLGIMHDGQRNNCDPNGFIMSERTGAGKIHWSRCSNKYLIDSINRRQLACLDTARSSESSMQDLSLLELPGQVYNINEQCQLAFGNNYSSYVTRQAPFNMVCRELWCVLGNWAKAAHPALEGSACRDGHSICREGKCVQQ